MTGRRHGKAGADEMTCGGKRRRAGWGGMKQGGMLRDERREWGGTELDGLQRNKAGGASGAGSADETRRQHVMYYTQHDTSHYTVCTL